MYSAFLVLLLLLLGSQITILTFALPVNPNLRMAHKWTANETQSASSTSSDQPSSCPEDQIYLKKLSNGLNPGCYPKVYRIFQSCLRKEQCQIDKSFCGYHEVNDYFEFVCRCNQGYSESWDNSTCEPYRECTLTDDFNDLYLQADCAKDQFCRKGSCHCKPNYQYNSAGKCVWDVPDVSEPGVNGSPDFWTILGGWLDLLWVKIALLIMFAFVISVPIVLLIVCKKLKNNQQEVIIYRNAQSQVANSTSSKLEDELKRLTQNIHEEEEEDQKANDQL